ncbi:hypothetical protein [Roseomonas marmotae]|uniref:Exonuclease domain-containing protein n=1 Tax=Roseomonas marmotae TaxID=2768161 RepID=A0ABS3KLN8_9PROT|nr:hypothetical protein [Roseomonas marmotae]MBO1077241.1 hypothetical protein [Roseomonas marmotae]QTI81077.1 hypothetical protein IAI58_17020 [Roseomonas marmotae]
MLTRAADPPDLPQLEAMAAQLAASGHYRVLRRITPRPAVTPPPGMPTRLGLLLDLETTGLDAAQDEIIEMAMRHGLFFEGHRARHDCEATLEILARPLPVSGMPGLARLLEGARQPRWRIWAVEAPFHHKDRLKARGYRWNAEEKGAAQPRAWFIEVAEAERAAECAFLCQEIYGRELEPLMQRITALERYSVRG